jgi:signal transduction histidine kinase
MPAYSRSDGLKLLGIVGFYLLTAWFTRAFFGGNDLVLFVWLAFGPATAAVYVFGNRMLLAVLLGSFLGYLLSDGVAASANGALRHTVVLFSGVWLLRRDKRFDPALDSLDAYLRLFAVAFSMSLVGAGLTQALGTLMAVPGSFTFLQFFAGVMLGTLIGIPIFLVWRKLPVQWATPRTMLLVILILGLSWLVGQVVFLDWMKDTLGQIARGYWMFLLVTWAAVALGPHGAVIVIGMTAIQGLTGAQQGTGFFSNDIARTHLSNYFFYNLCLSAVGLALASYFAQQQKAMSVLETYQRHLDAKVIELDQANAELATKNEEMESMIYTASHDLRSPLVNIQGFAQRLGKAMSDINVRLAQDDVPADVRSSLARVLDERVPAALGFIKSSSLKMDSLINGLLRLSRVGRAPLTIQALDMNAMLRDIIGTLTIQTQHANARIDVDVNLPPCLGDAAQINQVFTNLIDNAIKYRDPVRPMEIRISGRREGQRVRYAVSDTGLGIAAESQPKVWQLFHRLDPNGPVAGEGLGLTLVHRLLHRQRGRIDLTSTPGQGSCFTVDLPAVQSQGEPHP